VLIIEELVDKINRTGDANNLNQLHDEMDKNDMAMVMPMFNTNDNISHLLISSHKSNGRLFSNEEIVALKKVFTEAQYYINADVRLKQSHALAHSIAHEMKNPLGQLQLHLEQIKTYSQYQETQGKLLKEVDDAQSAIKQGKQLIEMILTEVANSSLEQEPMSVSSIQRLVLHAFHQFSFSTELEKSRVHVQIDTDFSIRVNDTLFNFVIFNLLRNAIYYFHDYPDSEVEIKGIIGKQHNRLVVKDTGPGIPPEVKSKVFEDFYSHGKTGGSGLGLSYCMRVMRSFGGSIECYSEPGSYTEFHLVFPALETEMMTPSCLQFVIAEPAPQEKIDNSTGLQRKTALVVDDNKVQRALVRLYLCQLGYDVIEAVNGLKGVESFNQHSVDFVIMDIQMPVMNGFEATERIKICNPEIPVIALTGESGDAERELIQKLMDAHIVKPASRADLLSVLRELNIMSTHSESTNSIVSPAI
ncbi:hybrid sensor histidine kinase/response regulator, partial [Vibrio aerogenes]